MSYEDNWQDPEWSEMLGEGTKVTSTEIHRPGKATLLRHERLESGSNPDEKVIVREGHEWLREIEEGALVGKGADPADPRHLEVMKRATAILDELSLKDIAKAELNLEALRASLAPDESLVVEAPDGRLLKVCGFSEGESRTRELALSMVNKDED